MDWIVCCRDALLPGGSNLDVGAVRLPLASRERRASSRELLFTLIERQLRMRAKRAGYGILWPIIAPLFLLGLYAFVFQRVFNVPLRHYPVFLFAGLLPWSFLAQTLPAASGSLALDAELIRRTPFRHELLPIAVVGVMTIPFTITLGGFVTYLALNGFLSYRLLPALVLPVVSLVLFVSGLAMLLATIDVRNRVVRNLLGNALTVWFFLVPIVYRPEMARGRLKWLRSLDPMNMIVGEFRDVLFWQRLSRPFHMFLMGILSAGFFLVALAAFRRLNRDLPKYV